MAPKCVFSSQGTSSGGDGEGSAWRQFQVYLQDNRSVLSRLAILVGEGGVGRTRLESPFRNHCPCSALWPAVTEGGRLSLTRLPELVRRRGDSQEHGHLPGSLRTAGEESGVLWTARRGASPGQEALPKGGEAHDWFERKRPKAGEGAGRGEGIVGGVDGLCEFE